ncbi:MAG: NADH-quinone oxidoreductase subunit J [Planctomycetota bacterium]|nr:NADH-quinone oxidoreductase subunit J [Planctomycetota bacterium]
MKVIGQLSAIALLTLREAIRRKIFLVLIIFAVALLSSMTFFASVDPSSRLRLLEMWSLRSTVFFAALVAIFFGAFTLPADFEEKRIHMVATKPIGKSTFFLGRYFGMAITIALFVAILGGISLGFLGVVKWIEGDKIPPLRAKPIVSTETLGGFGQVEVYTPDPTLRRSTGQPTGSLLWQFQNLPGNVNRIEGILGIGNRFFPEKKDSLVRLTLTGTPGKLYEEEKTLTTNTPFQWTFPQGLIENELPFQVTLSPAHGEIWLEGREDSLRIAGKKANRFLAQGSVQKLDSPPRLQAQGWATSALAWEFPDLKTEDFPEEIFGRIRVNIDPLHNLFRFTGPTRILIQTNDRSAQIERPVFAKTNEWTDFSFPRSILETGKPIQITLIAGDDDMRITGRPSSCELFQTDEWFAWNFMKGLFLVYGWILLILTATVVASSLVSGPLSVLTGVMILLVGSSYGFVTKAVKDVDRTLVRYYDAQEKGEIARTPDNIPPWLLEYSRTGSRIALLLFPDYRNFDFSQFLLEDLAVGPTDIGNALKALFSRLIILLFLGLIVMMYKDFG